MRAAHLYTWVFTALVVLASSAGDVLLSRAMKRIGDLSQLRRRRGILHVASRVLGSGTFVLAIACMTVAFFSLLVALSWADVSLVGPASASLTFVVTAIAARLFLHEKVDSRRWIAVILACLGVALLAS
jgi:drug/metabolite transporter (DMT)-like permease